MTTSRIKAYHQQVKQFFGTLADQKAKETGFVERRSKISGSLFVQTLVWTVYRVGRLTLSAMAATAEALEPKCTVSEQAFDERFTPQAAAFLQAMFALALHQTIPHPTVVVPLLTAFSAVYLLDSSTASLPDALQSHFVGCGGDGSKAAVKLFLLWDWLTGRCEALQLRDGRKNDQDMGKSFIDGKPSGALWIFDLGFWALDFLIQITAAGSYFLTRLQPQVAVYVKDEGGNLKRLDLDRFLRIAPRDRTFEFAVYLGAEHLLACRLICIPVPPQVANQRRRKARAHARRKGRTPTQRVLQRLDWNLFVVNAPAELLPTTVVETVYRVRWQIELGFKLAKSDAALDQTNSQKSDRVLCEFYAKLISLLLFERLMAILPSHSQRTISYPKAWRRLRDKLLPWGRKLRQGKGQACLNAIVEYLQRRAKTSKRRKYPSTIQRIETAARQAHTCCLIDPIGYMELRSKYTDAQLSHLFLYSVVNTYPAVA